MSQPTLQWDSIEGTIENIKLIYWNHPEMVWWNKIDNRYLIEVTRIGTHRDNRGKLRLFDHDKNDTEIFSLDVGLYYGAICGRTSEMSMNGKKGLLSLLTTSMANRANSNFSQAGAHAGFY